MRALACLTCWHPGISNDLLIAIPGSCKVVLSRPACLAGYSFLQGPSTCMIRPHPAVWRIIHGMVIIYMLALVFLLFQNADDARLLLKVLLSAVNQPSQPSQWCSRIHGGCADPPCMAMKLCWTIASTGDAYVA